MFYKLFFGIVVSGLVLTQCAFAVTLKGHVNEDRIIEEQSQPAVKGIVGLNIQIFRSNQPPVVVEVYSGTPAEEVGIKPGDEIIAVNHHPTSGLTVQQVDDAISDVPGEVVQFQMQRGGMILTKQVTVSTVEAVKQNATRGFYHQVFGE